MIASTKELTVSLNNGVRCIKFNRPKKKNAINSNMYIDIAHILNSDGKDDNVKICILTGTGDYYSSGNDILSSLEKASESADGNKKQLNNVKNFVKAFIDYPKLLIAIVNGPAIGVATTTLGLCDIVYASDKATFQTPFSKLGLCPEGCSSYTFPLIMGKNKTNEMLFLNHLMSASEAYKCGFVSEIVSHENLSQIFNKIYQSYSQVSLYSITISKKLLRRYGANILHEANEREIELLAECMESENFMNAVTNFVASKSKM